MLWYNDGSILCECVSEANASTANTTNGHEGTRANGTLRKDI
jgi:hypothetical protein